MSSPKRARIEDHSGFVHSVLQIMAKTAEASGQTNSRKISDSIKAMSSRDANRVAESRFMLGANDGSYLRQSVMPLQTMSFNSCDEEFDIGPTDQNLIGLENGQAAVLSAMEEEIESALKDKANKLRDELEVAAWLLTIPELHTFVQHALKGNKAAADLVAPFENNKNTLLGQSMLVEFKVSQATIRPRMDILLAIALIFGKPTKHMQEQMYAIVNKTIGEVMQSIDQVALAAKHSKDVYENDGALVETYESVADQFYKEYIPMDARSESNEAAPTGTSAVGTISNLGRRIFNFLNPNAQNAPQSSTPALAPPAAAAAASSSTPPTPNPPAAAAASSAPAASTAKISSFDKLLESNISTCQDPGSVGSQVEPSVLDQASSSALKHAFSRMREDPTFLISNQGNVQRMSGVSPFWSSKSELLIMRHGNEVDYWKSRVWGRTVQSTGSPEWLKNISNVKSKLQSGMEDSLVSGNILVSGASPFPAYCVLRGLCAYRPPHHAASSYPEEDGLLYSVPKLNFPQRKNGDLPVSIGRSSEETTREQLMFHDAQPGTISDVFALKPDAYRAKLNGASSFVEPAKVATWSPLYQNGNSYEVETRNSDKSRWSNSVSEAAVYEHAIDMFKSRMCTQPNDPDPKTENLILGAIAAAKIAQLDSMSYVFAAMRQNQSISDATNSFRSTGQTNAFGRIFLTRPVLLCFDTDVDYYNPSVLFPCDAGLASFGIVTNSTLNTLDDIKIESQRIKENELQVGEKLTPLLRLLLSGSKKGVGKVPLYVANPPTLENVDIQNLNTAVNSTYALRTDILPGLFPNLSSMNSSWYSTKSARTGVKLCKDLISLLNEKKRVDEYKSRPNVSQKSDELARSRRNIVWNDALREACISNDRLFAFVRQLSGTVNEQLDSVCLIDEGMLVQQQNKMREKRNRISERAAQEHINLVKSVFASVLKESGLTLGIDDASRSNNGGDIGELKVVSSTLRKQISDLASGNGQDGFFGNSVRMERLLSIGTGEMTLTDLFSKLQSVGKAFQEAIDESTINDMPSNSASIDFISAPRNSMMLRYKPEALAAIKYAFEIFQKEFAARAGIMYVPITAYELIEGNNDTMTTHFASFCGHMMAHSRMFGSSTAMYIGQWPSAANAQQLRLSLNRLVSAAITYRRLNGRPDFLSPNGRDRYFASAPSRYAQMFA